MSRTKLCRTSWIGSQTREVRWSPRAVELDPDDDGAVLPTGDLDVLGHLRLRPIAIREPHYPSGVRPGVQVERKARALELDPECEFTRERQARLSSGQSGS